MGNGLADSGRFVNAAPDLEAGLDEMSPLVGESPVANFDLEGFAFTSLAMAILRPFMQYRCDLMQPVVNDAFRKNSVVIQPIDRGLPAARYPVGADRVRSQDASATYDQTCSD
jgi:hypothetical protein